MGESPQKIQKSINLQRTLATRIDDAADHQGMKPGTLCSKLFEWAVPLFEKHDFNVARVKETFPDGILKLSNNVGNNKPADQLSEHDHQALNLLRHLESSKSGRLGLQNLAKMHNFKGYHASLTEATTPPTRAIAGRNPRKSTKAATH